MTERQDGRPWDRYIEFMLREAQSSADHTRDVIDEFCSAIESGQTPDHRILEYLAARFREQMEIDGSRLFPLLTPAPVSQGRTPQHTSDRNADRDLALAKRVRQLMNGGLPHLEARAQTAEEASVSESIVKRAHEAFGEYVRKRVFRTGE